MDNPGIQLANLYEKREYHKVVSMAENHPEIMAGEITTSEQMDRSAMVSISYFHERKPKEALPILLQVVKYLEKTGEWMNQTDLYPMLVAMTSESYFALRKSVAGLIFLRKRLPGIDDEETISRLMPLLRFFADRLVRRVNTLLLVVLAVYILVQKIFDVFSLQAYIPILSALILGSLILVLWPSFFASMLVRGSSSMRK